MNATAQTLAATHVVDATLPAEEWLTTLVELDVHARAVAARRAQAKRQFWLATGLGLALVVLGFALVGPAVGAAALAAWIVLVLALGARRSRLARDELPALLSRTIVPLVALLREDIEPRSPLRLALDVRPTVRDQTYVSATEPYAKGSYHKVVDTFHVQPWLLAELALIDGSQVAIQATDHVRRRKQTKRNPRGKIKTKTKVAVKTDLRVTVRFKNDVWTYDGVPVTGLQVKPGDHRTRLRMRRKRKLPGRVLGWKERALPGQDVEARDLMDAVAQAYKRARPA